MNDHHPDIDPAIAHLDFDICQWGDCHRVALWRIRFHFINHCGAPCCDEHQNLLDEDGNHIVTMCAECFELLRQQVSAHIWKLNHYGRPHCASCGSPIRVVNDVIRERTKL